MRILIIEDEYFAAKRMKSLIEENIPEHEIVGILDSVEDSVKWLKEHNHPNLIFMDIQLADDLSFKIFEKVTIKCPVIFTTAYDEYALEAFKVNSIDYLLKPIELSAFNRAIGKFEQLFSPKLAELDWSRITEQIFTSKTTFKERFLIKTGQAYSYLAVENIKLFYSEDGVTFAVLAQQKKAILDKTMDQIESVLDPRKYFRINRKYHVPITSIQKIHPYFNSRLKIELNFKFEDELIVSRDKVQEFKTWVDS